MYSKVSGSSRKVVIVGAGMVGSVYAYALSASGLADEIVLIDNNEELARGQVLDLVHGQVFVPTVGIRSGSVDDYRDAKLIVITAGAAQRPGETRLELLKKNAGIVGNIAENIAASGSEGVMLIVTNPVDVMTWVALKSSGWSRGRVIGSGTVLDSARFRHLLSKNCGVDVHNVHGYILGEHGDSEFAAWSMTNIAGMAIDHYCPVCRKCSNWKNERKKIEQQVRDSAYHIINAKGSTHFAVGLALVRITGAILRKQNSVMTVSTLLNGEYGLSDICISVPSIVTDGGVERIITGPLKEEETEALMKSAAILKKSTDSLYA